MNPRPLRYAAITPARNEAGNLRRLGACVAAQTVLPAQWVIVDDGSTDGTGQVARGLARAHEWVRVIPAPPSGPRLAALSEGRVSGRDIVAFNAGVAELSVEPDVVVKLDADVSFETDHFEQLLRRFAEDSRLGLASGTCYEATGDAWQPIFVTRGHVRGAVRAYRWRCFQAVLPLDERLGWDGVDEVKARMAGWRTTSFADLSFRHHRKVGARDGALQEWLAQGDVAHYLGYRPSYLLLKVAFRSLREPRAVGMLLGYLRALTGRRPRHADAAVRAEIRRQQQLRRVPLRIREALGRSSGSASL